MRSEDHPRNRGMSPGGWFPRAGGLNISLLSQPWTVLCPMDMRESTRWLGADDSHASRPCLLRATILPRGYCLLRSTMPARGPCFLHASILPHGYCLLRSTLLPHGPYLLRATILLRRYCLLHSTVLPRGPCLLHATMLSHTCYLPHAPCLLLGCDLPHAHCHLHVQLLLGAVLALCTRVLPCTSGVPHCIAHSQRMTRVFPCVLLPRNQSSAQTSLGAHPVLRADCPGRATSCPCAHCPCRATNPRHADRATSAQPADRPCRATAAPRANRHWHAPSRPQTVHTAQPVLRAQTSLAAQPEFRSQTAHPVPRADCPRSQSSVRTLSVPCKYSTQVLPADSQVSGLRTQATHAAQSSAYTHPRKSPSPTPPYATK